MTRRRPNRDGTVTRPPGSSPLALHAFVAGVALVGGAATVQAVISLWHEGYTVEWSIFGALAMIAGYFALKIPGVPVRVSLSDTFFLASALLFGPGPATVTIALDSLIMTAWHRRTRGLSRLIFNATAPTLALWAGAQCFEWLSDGFRYRSPQPVETLILPLVCLTAVYFGLNSMLMAVAIGLEKKAPPLTVWRQHFSVIGLNYLASASLAFFFVVVAQFASLLALATVLPLFAVFHLSMRSWTGRLEDAERHVATVDRLYLSTIEALSSAIEAKDGVTSSHIHRVQHYAMGLAREAGVTEPLMLKALQAAALVHDTGKLAVPERILNKPGKLTADEFETMKLHVNVGADILSAIDFPYPVVPIVRSHHENWDGSGYPRGLRGEEIPIGARILMIVDCFDALTSDRPYRRGMGPEAALAIMLPQAGIKFDPHLLAIFARTYETLAPGDDAPLPGPHYPTLRSAVQQINRATEWQALPPAGELDVPESLTGMVSLARIVNGRGTAADIAAVAWHQVRPLMPATSCALFSIDPGANTLVSVFAAGDAATALQGLRIPMGDRLSGWVAENRQAIVNSDARLDLGEEASLVSLRSCLSLPLVTGESTLAGVLTCYAPAPFAEDQVTTLQQMAPHLAEMLTRVRASERDAGTVRAPSLRVVAGGGSGATPAAHSGVPPIRARI